MEHWRHRCVRCASVSNCAGGDQLSWPFFLNGHSRTLPQEREQPFALANACKRACRRSSLSKRLHLRKRGRQRTMCEAAGTGPVGPAAHAGPTRSRCASACGARNKYAAPAGAPPQVVRDRARHQPRSSKRLVLPLANTKKGQEPSPAPALFDAQNSSSIAPCTVCTTRLARCAGKAL